MRARKTIRKRRSETGIALLIAIFILLLIGVVAIALIVSSSTETALAGNYRSSTNVYYAAVAGLEEARARLRSNNPNSFNNTAPGFLPPSGTPLAACAPVYVINPVGGEAVTPWDSASTYPDNEFGQEFGGICGAPPNPSPTTASVWNRSPLNGLPFPGPFYKWVRINAVTEQSLNLDTYPYNGIDSNLIYYDGLQQRLNDQGTGSQVLEITALAVLPNGSQKLLQYLVTPQQIALPPFLAALSLLDGPGNSVKFHAPTTNSSYAVKGNDQDCSGNLTGTNYPAIGVFNNPDQNAVINGIPSGYRASYTGSISPGPDVERIDGLFPANLQSPAPLDALAQSIIQNADAVITPPPSGTPPYLGTAYASDLQKATTTAGMSSSNPVTVVVNGSLDISSWSNDGYGLLLVTGTFTYDPDTTWNGIVLVIGQGIVKGDHQQFKQINGAMLVAKTRDSVTNQVLLGSLLGATVVFDDDMQGNGIRYSSCWIQKAQPTSGYKILSFHEIAQ
jgi:hypothetical protein